MHGTVHLPSFGSGALVAVILLGAVLTPAVAARSRPARGKILGHDDGKMDSRRSMAGTGHAVRFARPGEVFTVTGVKLHGSAYGARYDPNLTVARVSVCDLKLRPLAQTFVPYAAWDRGHADWVDLAIRPCLVPEEFFIVVEYFPQQTKGIYQSIDSDRAGHSFSAVPEGRLGPALADGEWMIRVVGEPRILEIERPDIEAAEELAAGQGEMTGKASIAGSGHAVLFKTPSRKKLLTAVSLYGSRYGGGYDAGRTFCHLFVCDKKLRVLGRFCRPYSIFPSGSFGWVRIDLPAIQVPRDFCIVAAFDPTATRGVYVGKWREKPSRSMTALPGGRPERLEKGTGWMIRATLAPSAGKQPLTLRGDPDEASGSPGTDESSGLSALEIAELLERIDEAERREDVQAAERMIRDAADQSPADAPRFGQIEESDHFILRRFGLPDEHARTLLRLMDQAHEALTRLLDIEEVSAIPGRKIHLHVEIGDGLETTLFTSPNSPEYPLIVFRGPARALRSPEHGGPHNVYGFCHELGHVLIGWEDARHQWAHFIGSRLVDEVQRELGSEVWADSYDASAIEGWSRFAGEIHSVRPGRDTDARVARLFQEIAERFGAGIYGKALAWIKEHRKGKPFHAVRLYRLDDLRDALVELTGKNDAIRELFDEDGSLAEGPSPSHPSTLEESRS